VIDRAAGGRLAALDVLRGVAVLGILAVNIAGFAGPRLATVTPAWNGPAPWWDEAAFAFVFLVFEGKMRALFSILFGASMLLFVEAAERWGEDGDLLQLRRLGWLLGFGYLHYLLLWWGDILFDYAVAGFLALLLRRLSVRGLLIVAAVVFLGWHGWGMADGWAGVLAEEHVRLGMAGAGEQAMVQAQAAADLARMQADAANARLGFGAAVAERWAREPAWPLSVTFYTLGETLPLMLLGMALLRGGFFAATWPRRRLRAMAWGGIGLGGGLTMGLLALVWARHFPPMAMAQVLAYWGAVPHVLMALGYAAALTLAMPGLLASRLGARLAAAGRMAFTNYLATTAAMTFLFYGWGLGWFGLSPALQLPVVAGWWLVMLAWSAPWLARFRQGPLEWLWRSLTEWRVMPR